MWVLVGADEGEYHIELDQVDVELVERAHGLEQAESAVDVLPRYDGRKLQLADVESVAADGAEPQREGEGRVDNLELVVTVKHAVTLVIDLLANAKELDGQLHVVVVLDLGLVRVSVSVAACGLLFQTYSWSVVIVVGDGDLDGDFGHQDLAVDLILNLRWQRAQAEGWWRHWRDGRVGRWWRDHLDDDGRLGFHGVVLVRGWCWCVGEKVEELARQKKSGGVAVRDLVREGARAWRDE